MGAGQAGWGEDDFSSLARHYAYPGTVKDRTAGQVASEVQLTSSEKSPDSKKKGFFGFLGRPKAVAP